MEGGRVVARVLVGESMGGCAHGARHCVRSQGGGVGDAPPPTSEAGEYFQCRSSVSLICILPYALLNTVQYC